MRYPGSRGLYGILREGSSNRDSTMILRHFPSARLPHSKPRVQTPDSTKTTEDSGGLRRHWKITFVDCSYGQEISNCLVPVWLQQGYPRIFKFPDTHNIPQLHFQSWWILSIGPSIISITVGAVAVLATLTPGRPSTKARFAIPSQICGILGDFRLGAAHLSGKKGRRFSYGCYPKNSFLRINTPFSLNSWCPKMKSSRTKPWVFKVQGGAP